MPFPVEYSEHRLTPMMVGTRATWIIPNSKVLGANMGPTWGRQDSGGPDVGHVNLAIWDLTDIDYTKPF